MDLQATIGDSETLLIPLRWKRQAFEPGSAWGLTLTVKASAAEPDSAALFQKATGGLGLTVSGATAHAEILRADTCRAAGSPEPGAPAFEAAAGLYVYDVQATGLSGGAYDGQCRTVAAGSYDLRRDVTRAASPTVAIFTTEDPVLTATGPQGEPGIQGPQGIQGTTGTAATIAIGAVATGAAGSSASVANAGTAAAAVLDFTLPRGDKGETGPANSLTIASVTTGAAGSSASVSVGGSSPAQTLSFSIPRGDTGATGATGQANTLTIAGVTTGAAGSDASVTVGGTSPAQTLTFAIPRGDKGETGTAATLAVGTVTTGAAGSSAAITNSGTAGAAVFDFAIPQGAQGIQGIQGPTGATGPANSLTIAAVTTGAAGSSAAVSVGGSSPAQTLSFSIPRGDTGATGAIGPQPSLTVNDNASAAITLADSDNNTMVRCTSSSAVTVTVPSTLAAGFSCMILQAGAGQVTLAAGLGSTLNSFGALLKTAGQHAPASILRTASATYNLSGNLV